MALIQERPPKNAVLRVGLRYGAFYDDFTVALNGDILFQGSPRDALEFCLAFRRSYPNLVDIKFDLPHSDSQAALMGMRAAQEILLKQDAQQAPI